MSQAEEPIAGPLVTIPTPYIHHVAFPINPSMPLATVSGLFARIGFVQEWYQKNIGDGITGMETSVEALGSVRFAVMRGIDGRTETGARIVSQVNRYFALFGSGAQHYAFRVHDIDAFAGAWYRDGVRFVTAHDDGTPRILVDADESGSVVLQTFTYGLYGFVIPVFFELNAVMNQREAEHRLGRDFRERNVEGLWESLDRVLTHGGIFEKNIFGEPITIPPRYQI